MQQKLDGLENRFDKFEAKTTSAIEKIKESDIEQKTSLKSIHKRLDQDSIIRLEDAKVRMETHDVVIKQTEDLKNHIAWEEKKYNLKQIAEQKASKLKKENEDEKDKKESVRFVITTSLLTIATGTLIGAISWLLLATSNSKEDIARLQVDFRTIPIIIENKINKATEKTIKATIEASKKNRRATKYQIDKIAH